MDDDALIAKVLADPSCPVEALEPETGRSWPRTRVELPSSMSSRAGETYLHVCRCQPSWARMRGESVWIQRPRPVELVARKWAWPAGREQGVAWVYLGQCGQCGHIYWAILTL